MMIRQILSLLALLAICGSSAGQSKTLIAIVAFKSQNNAEQYKTAIQDAVADAFLKTKRFSLVEREKMEQLNTEKTLQKDEDFIDGQVIEQSKSLGAQYVVLGNISKAAQETKQNNIPYVGVTTSVVADISFNIRVVDVATGEVMASNRFTQTAKGKNSFEEALKKVRPDIETFIRDNFKITATLASIEEKNASGEAVKVLISGGRATGVQEKNEFKVYELSEMLVDGKKLTRKKTIGKIVVAKVEDENFSICTIMEGAPDITKKMEAGAKIKCEVIN